MQRLLLTAFLFALCGGSASAQVPDKYRPTVDKGLKWLAAAQQNNGTWALERPQYTYGLTAFCGLVFLQEGSTLNEGKYTKTVRAAADALIKRGRADAKNFGLIGDPDWPDPTSRKMVQHGCAVSFLARVYMDADAPNDRKRLQAVLKRAVIYSTAGQSKDGGWFYEPDSPASENIATVLQLRGLIDARNAGMPVAKDTLKKAHELLKRSTTRRGGIVYSLNKCDVSQTEGGERPVATAGALTCFPLDMHPGEHGKRWLRFCAAEVERDLERKSINFLFHCWFSEVACELGDDGWQRLFPDDPPAQRLTWTKYRAALFDRLQALQSDDGSWASDNFGSLSPILDTALALIILQQDNRPLPLSR